MNADIAKGSYITSQYPPFFASKITLDDYISPFDTDIVAHEYDNTTFWEYITPAQQQRYYDKIDTILKKAEAESGKPIDEATVLFAHYQVDFHIRQHYLAPRSILNLCRSKDDIRSLTHWQWKTAIEDENAFTEFPDWGVGWVHEPSNSLGHQIAAWRMGERGREKHLAEVQARWAEIKDERRKQRMRTTRILFKGEHPRISHTTSSNLTAYAQDPDFKTDEPLLAALSITVIKHPEVFSLITITTMLFCPDTEREHLELLVPSNLWLLFDGPLSN
ncbi:hypothetical protein PENFLA_c012G04183 [Penicillium flavigenum]|uniref:Uncharacterized protein n=1 Tax=Penicillium flavigenum TaxID=254877 RepID=A0A1V6TA38_9EURO|nr:hypothetical protein PENFLA_c012G04183 [Penicillium flavigenum]